MTMKYEVETKRYSTVAITVTKKEVLESFQWISHISCKMTDFEKDRNSQSFYVAFWLKYWWGVFVVEHDVLRDYIGVDV